MKRARVSYVSRASFRFGSVRSSDYERAFWHLFARSLSLTPFVLHTTSTCTCLCHRCANLLDVKSASIAQQPNIHELSPCLHSSSRFHIQSYVLLVWKRRRRERFFNRYEVGFVENDLTFQPPRQGLPSKTNKKSPKIQKYLKSTKVLAKNDAI